MIAPFVVLAFLGAEAKSAIDFDTQIIPVLTKAGCNAGACHGAAAGRGGFHLSLLGGDAVADHDVIVNAFEGRRINLAKPELSLLLRKPTGQLDHGGDVVLDEEGEGVRRLLAWIGSGAQRDGHRRLTGFRVAPVQMLVGELGDKVPLQAFARFNGQPEENVTQWTVFTSADSSALEIDPETLVATVNRRGQHMVIARFLDRVVPLQVLLPLSEQPVDLARESRRSFVDDEVLTQLALLRLPVSPPADDATFLRRVCLDLTGRLPHRTDLEAFLADKAVDKREQLVDRLLASAAYVDYWTYRMAALLRVQPGPKETEGATTYYDWIRDQIRDDASMSDVARALLTGEGDSHVVGPANFARTTADARAQAELVSQVFMGARLQCANCHNHPLDRWTQDDYHGLAAVFARLGRDRIVKLEPRGSVTNPRTGEPAIPRIPGERDLDANGDGRLEIANWIVAPDNSYFARATVNRLWQSMFGRGLVEPVDDLRETNPATHPELLDLLARDFIEHGCRLRHTLRLLALSQTYGRSGTTTPANHADDRFYSHSYQRALEPEVLADAIADTTGVFDQYGELPLGTRAVALMNPRTSAESLDILGRCSRRDSCEGVVASQGLPARLHQLNGDLINRKIVAEEGWVQQQLTAETENAAIVVELYCRAVGRHPTADELAYWQEYLGHGTGRAERLEDLAWGLLNCSEFSMNH